ncbi:MBL fold metallo-hydrolase [Halopseudomonas pachastrellae]|uniref:MBL fold metallo-hydrolase n=1 Tax=Halopseudomonas pachastrellae TaxID=254161 RepID=UPI003D7CE6DB
MKHGSSESDQAEPHSKSERFVDWRPARAVAMLVSLAVALRAGLSGTFRDPLPVYPGSAQFRGERFRNDVSRSPMSFRQGLALWRDFIFNKPSGTVPKRAIPVQKLTRSELLAAPDNSVWRLGHSSLVFKLNGAFWLTDPVFSMRASPVQWLGPKRFHAPPISIEELPPIKVVVLSHNHYDHLDHAAIRQLQHKVEHFITPLGVGATLVRWGVPPGKVRELDWWQQVDIDGVAATATPAQHFSGRGLSDGNRTLWCSWVLQSAECTLFFSGDTGYFDGFREIGERLGPFDVAFMETGAYNPRWQYVHMMPAQTMQAFLDLGASWLYPIHNGTFDLSMHTWEDPFEQITQLAQEHSVSVTTPQMGQVVDMLAPDAGGAWWRA